MSKNYKQLSPEQRYQIESLLHCGISQKQIATTINVNASTISRELKRNTPQRGRGALQYGATNAQRRTALRHKEKSKHQHFTKEMQVFCSAKLIDDKWSPEFISIKGVELHDDFVRHETICK